MSELDRVYRRFKALTNMSCARLQAWARNPCSRAASLSRGPLRRNIRLACKRKAKWTARDVRDAKRTISFVSRMKGMPKGEPVSKGCPSKRDISLKNWAHRPGGA